MTEVTYYCTNCGHRINSKNKIKSPTSSGYNKPNYVYSTAAWCCGKVMTRRAITPKGDVINDGI